MFNGTKSAVYWSEIIIYEHQIISLTPLLFILPFSLSLTIHLSLSIKQNRRLLDHHKTHYSKNFSQVVNHLWFEVNYKLIPFKCMEINLTFLVATTSGNPFFSSFCNHFCPFLISWQCNIVTWHFLQFWLLQLLKSVFILNGKRERERYDFPTFYFEVVHKSTIHQRNIFNLELKWNKLVLDHLMDFISLHTPSSKLILKNIY